MSTRDNRHEITQTKQEYDKKEDGYAPYTATQKKKNRTAKIATLTPPPRVSKYPSRVSGLWVSCDIIKEDVT